MAEESRTQGGQTSAEKSNQNAGSDTTDAKGEASAQLADAAAGEDAITLLKSDHRNVEQLFSQYKTAKRRDQKNKIVQQVCQELIVHTKIEEEIFYPACREHVDDDLLDEAQVEHDGAKTLINELLAGQPSDEFYDAKVAVLSEYIKHHVAEEEKRTEGIFAKAKAGGLDMKELGQRIAARKAELTAQAEAGRMERPQPRSFAANAERSPRMEDRMAQSNVRDRDDRGRFVSDDDDDRRGRGRSRNDDDDRRYSASNRRSQYDDDDRRGGGRMPERDEYGRFMSDDDRNYSSRGRSRDDDDDRRGRRMPERDEYGRFMSDDEDDRRYSRSSGSRGRYDDDRRSDRDRGQGGWFGDPRGHSEASRRGWRTSDHEGSGWYGDPEGHSEASRRGWRASDHEGSGWYGDPEGHSEASRRGWEARGGSRGRSRYDDDDRRSSARGDGGRSRYEDDDRRSSDRDRGQGGWFGDSEGHSEAARRGWENRR